MNLHNWLFPKFLFFLIKASLRFQALTAILSKICVLCLQAGGGKRSHARDAPFEHGWDTSMCSLWLACTSTWYKATSVWKTSSYNDKLEQFVFHAVPQSWNHVSGAQPAGIHTSLWPWVCPMLPLDRKTWEMMQITKRKPYWGDVV